METDRRCAVQQPEPPSMRHRAHSRILPLVLLLAAILLVHGITLRQPRAAWGASAGTPQDPTGEDGDVAVELVPTSVDVPGEGIVEIRLVVRNPTTDVLRHVAVRWFGDAGVEITLAEGGQVRVPTGDLLREETVPAKADRAWDLRVSRAAQGPLVGTVHFQVEYDQQPMPYPDATPPVTQSRIGFADLAVKNRDPDAVDQVAEVSVKAAELKLDEKHDGRVYLAVTNKSTTVPITVDDVQATSSHPDYLTLTPEAYKQEIAPGAVRTIPIRVGATDAVEPGKQLLIFEVPIEWEKAGRRHVGNLVATQEAEVGVFGESAVLSALGVPAFFLLPGFIAIVALGFLWGLRKPAPDRDNSPIKPTTPGFWLLAITVSIVTAWLYPKVTKRLFDVSRDYLVARGLWDVVAVWLSSFAVGIVLFLLLWAAIKGWEWQGRRAWAALLDRIRGVPSRQDDPTEILRKMQKRRLGLRSDRVDVKFGSETVPGLFMVQPWDGVRKTFWVAPAIEVELRDGVDRRLREDILDQLKKPRGDAKTLAACLETGQQARTVDVRWAPSRQPFDRPYEAKAEDLVPQGSETIIEFK